MEFIIELSVRGKIFILKSDLSDIQLLKLKQFTDTFLKENQGNTTDDMQLMQIYIEEAERYLGINLKRMPIDLVLTI